MTPSGAPASGPLGSLVVSVRLVPRYIDDTYRGFQFVLVYFSTASLIIALSVLGLIIVDLAVKNKVYTMYLRSLNLLPKYHHM